MLGFDVDNSIFESHSRFFRDALVRANYANIRKGIYEDRDPLDAFFSDLMLGTSATLGVSVKTVERHLKNLPIHFSGPAKTGEWVVEQ